MIAGVLASLYQECSISRYQALDLDIILLYMIVPSSPFYMHSVYFSLIVIESH